MPITARPPISAAAGASGTAGSLPARVTGPGRQNQSHNAQHVPVARAPTLASARSTTRTSAASGTTVMTVTDRVRKSIERRSMDARPHEQGEPLEPLEQVPEDPLERLTADLTALSMQHAAAVAAAVAITTASASNSGPAAATSPSTAPAPPAAAGRSSRPQGASARYGSASASTSSGPASGPGPVHASYNITGGASSSSSSSTLQQSMGAQADSRRCDLGDTGLPAQLLALRDPACPVSLPPPGGLPSSCLPLDNWKLDKLVLSLSANKATWRRSLLLFEWLKAAGHQLDDRLCTTLIRVCSDHGDAVSALAVYDWMTGSSASGGAALEATAYTYTAAMRAALAGGLTDRALSIWNEAWRRHSAGRLQLDCRLCITYLELCTRLGLTDQALAMYAAMRAAPAGSRMAPTVHAYTAAMRAATEGGRWYRALDIWADMRAARCEPTGHAYSAAISACAAAGDWRRAVALFDEMTGPGGIRPDVVSCTALITALAAGGEADRAEAVVAWMLSNSVRPNARTYTALMAALGNAKRWARAVEVLGRMQTPEWGGVQPNAYTYSALLKSLGEHGQWQLAEAVFSSIERQVLGPAAGSAPPAAAALSLASALVPAAVPPPSPLAAMFAEASATAAAAAAAVASAAGSVVHPPASPSGPEPSSSSAPSQWTRPSQLNGLVLDLNMPSTSSSATETGPSRRSFSLFSHPPAPSSSAATSYVASSAGTSGRSSFSTDSAAPSDGSAAGASEAWRSTLDHASASALAGQLAAMAAAASGCGAPGGLPTVPEAELVAFPTADREEASSSIATTLAPGVYTPGVLRAAAGVAPPPPPPPPMPSSSQQQLQSAAAASSSSTSSSNGTSSSSSSSSSSSGGVLNEVVCGALMLAYERAGKWQEAVAVLLRALNLGISPNTVMYNTAISAAGKAGQLEIAEKLYSKVRQPDSVTHETMIAAYGMAGLPERAEAVFSAMTSAGLRPRDFAFCGLIAAHSLAGNWEGAMRVRARMRRAGVQPSVHVYNALLAACERAGQPDRALELLGAMRREGVEPNTLTANLLQLVGRQGVRSVESQQQLAASVSAALAAYGALLMQTGLF
ncbi:hypothetical protein HYH02_013498 [Chlamydomonas schloesseri]|uniref:Pentacotripeptide-repeat region of PRORP domain-containing protein n=1 Tax=Chlamydomonas schloesseri TaxID=2026947 RepID=A0A835T1Y4_9CHLO|nr:hypothetical protein HYH02_013498 [Chlamydomonas schloesseri]|eukprot:KAG2430965.1 hypothetical protein HYH02_013498 [Chlamydomonas schloesseri]